MSTRRVLLVAAVFASWIVVPITLPAGATVAGGDGDIVLAVVEGGGGSREGSGVSTTDGVAIVGGDFRRLDDAIRWERCQHLCILEGRCRAWTFVKPGFLGPDAKCDLKDRFTSYQQTPCCVSGTVGLSPRERDDYAKTAFDTVIVGTVSLVPDPGD
jgi:PAN domain-containing protein